MYKTFAFDEVISSDSQSDCTQMLCHPMLYVVNKESVYSSKENYFYSAAVSFGDRGVKTRVQQKHDVRLDCMSVCLCKMRPH